MPRFLLNTIALDPNRWTADKQPYVRLGDVLPRLAEAGFLDLEVWQYHLSTLDDAAFHALQRRADETGMRMPIVGLYPVLDAAGDDRERAWLEVERVLTRASALGAGVVKFFAGRLGSAQASPDAYDRSTAFAQRMAARAAALDLMLTVETHPDTLCDSMPATWRFLDDVAADQLAVCYQPFDFTDTARAVADFASLSEHVRHLHLQGRRDDVMCLLAEADIDYRTLLRAVFASGFDGYVGLEFVAGCVVPTPERFDLDRVLANAQRDRAYVAAIADAAGQPLEGVPSPTR